MRLNKIIILGILIVIILLLFYKRDTFLKKNEVKDKNISIKAINTGKVNNLNDVERISNKNKKNKKNNYDYFYNNLNEMAILNEDIKDAKIKYKYEEYKKLKNKLETRLKLDSNEVDKLIYKYYPYIIKYKKLKQNKNLYYKQYEKFLLENLKKEGINIRKKELEDLDIRDLKKFVKLKEELSNYLIWDILVNKEVKMAFERFKSENYDNLSDDVIFEDYLITVNKENLKIKGECDKLVNDIDKVECMYFNNIK